MNMTMEVKDRMLGGLWGAVVGDALGVPVEFKPREEVRMDPVTGMRGYGTYKQPPGTWSDDSSLLLCTVESLVNGFDIDDMAGLFVRFKDEGYWTPHGKMFDIGAATSAALIRFERGTKAIDAGGDGENENGNGSLMRVLPVALRFFDASVEELMTRAHECSSITHRHPRSLLACGFFCLMASSLLKGFQPERACGDAVEITLRHYDRGPWKEEFPHFGRVLDGKIALLGEDEINSSGYVVDTLEAAVWCVLTTASFSDAVLKAVNLGGDADTTGCVTGGLAGIACGAGSIPGEWLSELARRDDIEALAGRFIGSLGKT